MQTKKNKQNKWRRIVDNKMPWYGETDLDRRVIRINKKKAKTKPTRKTGHWPELLDGIFHEELHRKHPKMHEKTIRRKTTKAVKRMSRKAKQRLYKLFK